MEHVVQRRGGAAKVFNVLSGNPRHLAIGHALGRWGFADSLGRRLAEEHDRANEFVGELLGEVDQ